MIDGSMPAAESSRVRWRSASSMIRRLAVSAPTSFAAPSVMESSTSLIGSRCEIDR